MELDPLTDALLDVGRTRSRWATARTTSRRGHRVRWENISHRRVTVSRLIPTPVCILNEFIGDLENFQRAELCSK